MIKKRHQTFFDFVLQHAGSLSAVFDTALSNNISITADVAAGTQLTITVADATIVGVLKRGGYEISNDFEADAGTVPGGIGFMKIGQDFKVS